MQIPLQKWGRVSALYLKFYKDHLFFLLLALKLFSLPKHKDKEEMALVFPEMSFEVPTAIHEFFGGF